MVPMNWKEKLLDELISRATLYVVLFTAVIALVDLSQNQQLALVGVATLALANTGAKTIVNGLKAKALIQANGPASTDTTTTETKEGGNG